MSDVAGTRPDLWFLTPPAPDRWHAFAAYFADRGYRWYTWPMTATVAPFESLSNGSNPPETNMVIVARRVFPRTFPSVPRLKAWALLEPSGRSLMGLRRQAPPRPGWIGLGSRQGLVIRILARRFRSSPPFTVHTFEGLGADLPFAPGWERVAYALRRWLEEVVCGGEEGAANAI